MNADVKSISVGWIRVAIEISGILMMIGFYLSTVRSNSVQLYQLQEEYQQLAPLSQTEKAINDQRYEEIERQLGDISETLRLLQSQSRSDPPPQKKRNR